MINDLALSSELTRIWCRPPSCHSGTGRLDRLLLLQLSNHLKVLHQLSLGISLTPCHVMVGKLLCQRVLLMPELQHLQLE